VYLIFARIAKAKKFYNIDRKSYILFFCLLMKIVSGENLFCEWFKEYFELFYHYRTPSREKTIENIAQNIF